MAYTWIDAVFYRVFRRFLHSPRWILGEYVKPGITVLDVGCGTGFFSIGMAKIIGSDGRIVSVDPDTEAIESLTQRAAELGLSQRIETRICTDHELNVDDFAGRVDFAVGGYVVHEAADASKLFADVYAALKPEGRFLMIEPRHHGSAPERGASESAAQQAGFTIADRPRIMWDWAVMFAKSKE